MMNTATAAPALTASVAAAFLREGDRVVVLGEVGTVEFRSEPRLPDHEDAPNCVMIDVRVAGERETYWVHRDTFVELAD